MHRTHNMAQTKKDFSAPYPYIQEYVMNLILPEDPELSEIRARAKANGLPNIHIGPMDARHLEVFTRALRPSKVLEIGSLAGYSSLCLARGLGENGKLTCLELHPKNAGITAETFSKYGFDSKCKVICTDALTYLKDLEMNPTEKGTWDLIFIDANKTAYLDYFEKCIELLKIGGSLLVDNTFAWGLVSQPEFYSRDAYEEGNSIKKFNAVIASHPQFKTTMLPTGDGLTFSVKLY
jgi:caffeoyl-CoA O-methyltransferase